MAVVKGVRQLLNAWKSPMLVDTAVTVNSELLLLVNVNESGLPIVPTGCVPKASIPGVKPTRMVGVPVAVPVRGTTCWLLGSFPALSLMSKKSVRLPVVPGLNVMLTVHDKPGFTGELHVVPVTVKSPVCTNALLKFKGVVPVFLRVKVWGGLVVPTAWFGKVRLLAERVTAGAPVAVPLTTMSC